MPATVWSGFLTFGLISMPVRLFSGARGSRVSFHMLHRTDHVRLKQQLICPEEGVVVSREDTVKGFEYRKGEYVIVEPEEIKRIEPKTAKAMEILQFVKADEIDPIYFESSYYLMPEEAGRRPYALLTRAMEETGHVAIAKLTMHNREYTVFLRPAQGGIMLHTMYYEDEVKRLDNFGKLEVDVKDSEVKVAHQLVQALSAKFEPEKFHDSFEENLKKLIEARIEGREVVAVEKSSRPAPVGDLMAALKQSLAQVDKKPPRRVEAAEAGSRVKVMAKRSAGKKGKKAA